MSEVAYTPQELMVAVASREIRDGDLVFVGMRLPILAYAVARNAHAPSARGLFEVGLLRDQPAVGFLGTMGDPPNVAGALWATRMSNAMALMAQGHVDLGFIGGAEVDRFGNLNTSYVGDPAKPTVKLPGSGGGADIAILSRRWVTLMSHERRRLVEKVSFVTSPGHGDGTPGWRERNGLLGGGPRWNARLARAARPPGRRPGSDHHDSVCAALSRGRRGGPSGFGSSGAYRGRGARGNGLGPESRRQRRGDRAAHRL